jgi:hypothetical protein
MNNEQLAAIRARAEKATKGPWETEWEQIQYERWNRRYGEFHAYAMTPMVVAKSVDDKEAVAKAIEQVEADADFIANARTDIPALLADGLHWRAECERLRAALSGIETLTAPGTGGDSGFIIEGAYAIAFNALEASETELSHGLGAQGEGEEDATG